MATTVRDLILILQIFFPAELSIHKAFYVLGVIISVYPLLRLHLNQRRQPHQPVRSAWTTGILGILKAAFECEDNYPPIWASGIDRGDEYAQNICDELSPLYQMLGLDPHNLAAPSPDSLFTAPRITLCTLRLSCMFCPAGDLNIVPTLRRRVDSQIVWVLDEHFCWVEADLVIAHCATCRADYFPDRVTYKDDQNRRRQRLELAPEYLRVSKHGIWVHKRISLSQENAVQRFHAGWSNFADWVNDTTQTKRKFTYRQSQRLFIEHFARRLLLFHNRHDFSCEAHPSTRLLAEAIRAAIGVNEGVLDAAMKQGCTGCTHLKRYRSDLIAEGAVLGGDQDVAGLEDEGGDEVNNDNGNPAGGLALPPQQNASLQGAP
ncbi:hypothetical protein MVEN_00032600 [Mycena venus]|uniref:CxC5 like cysteine cluster associated with KDZ domain-containing protein n=1 Tax=Mycena venus TaxID=2733690 RepID=A0A8H6Z365_9AGAR|nr:hypothetical protein MVEN_00032600 [Mycena venus]